VKTVIAGGILLVVRLTAHRFMLILQCAVAMTCHARSEQSHLDKPLALFFENRFEQALPLFEQIAGADQKNVEARTWLAETYRRLGRKDDAIKAARMAIALDRCHGFAHLVLAQTSYPDHDTIAVHVARAIQCDSTDPNGWLMMWGEAIRHADPALRDTCLRKLVETGFFTEAALAYGRAELRTLPGNAILFTNGDMDTYPAQAVQVTEGFRPDVAVIERGHLGLSWGCRFIRDHQNVPLPVPDAQLDSMKDTTDASGNTITPSDRIFRALIRQKLNGAMQRPIAIAPTVEESFYSWNKEYFRYQGMFLLWQPVRDDRSADTTAIRKCLDGIDPDSFSGPWASMKDRSPVRRFYTKQIVRILFDMALTYCQALIKAKRHIEAERTLQWLENFETNTELGNVSTEEIAGLRNAIKKNRQ
jgi:tetratricopeptide (TPR) repeat protein